MVCCLSVFYSGLRCSEDGKEEDANEVSGALGLLLVGSCAFTSFSTNTLYHCVV
jgi:hypothetical protein